MNFFGYALFFLNCILEGTFCIFSLHYNCNVTAIINIFIAVAPSAAVQRTRFFHDGVGSSNATKGQPKPPEPYLSLPQLPPLQDDAVGQFSWHRKGIQP